jgi:hypothetical protein
MRPAILALVALLAGCSSPSANGSLHSEAGVLGTWNFQPKTCRGGGELEFDGVDLSDGVRNVRVLNDPAKGYVVTISPDGDPARPAVVLTAASCHLFVCSVSGDPAVDATGRAELDCTTDGNGQVTGLLTFDNCGS